MTIDNTLPLPASSGSGGRCAAILLAAVLAAGGASLLFGDVIFGAADFTQKHFQTVCIVLGTTFASLVAAIAWENRHWLACAGFIALAAAGTLVIVWYSLGRQTEGQMLSSDDHDQAVATRLRLEAQRTADTKAHAEKRKDADALCRKHGPEHRRCLGARAVEAVYADSLAGLEARLKDLKVKPADPSAEAFANAAEVFGYSRDKAKVGSGMFMPYLITGLFELGFTMAVHYAFRPRHLPAPAKVSAQLSGITGKLPAAVETAQTSFAADASVDPRWFGPVDGSKGGEGGVGSTVRPPKGPNSGSPKRRMSHSEIVSDLMLRSVTGQRFGSNEEAAAHYGYSPSRFSELVTRWERQKRIPKGRMVGRCKEIAAAD